MKMSELEDQAVHVLGKVRQRQFGLRQFKPECPDNLDNVLGVLLSIHPGDGSTSLLHRFDDHSLIIFQ
jgi:hypothetical protein